MIPSALWAGRAASGLLKYGKWIAGGAAGIGILGGTMRDDRGFFRSVGGTAWGGVKGGVLGGLLGAGAGALLPGVAGKIVKNFTPLGARAWGAVVGGSAGATVGSLFGMMKGGIGSNRGYGKISGLHQ